MVDPTAGTQGLQDDDEEETSEKKKTDDYTYNTDDMGEKGQLVVVK